jgi:hypothetical protein
MAETGSPSSWVVETEELAGGQTRIRYAYLDGAAGEVLVPTITLGSVDHEQLASFVRKPPPGPRRPSGVG